MSIHSSSAIPSKKTLRKLIRSKRRALSSQQRKQASRQLSRVVSTSRILLKGRHIALYLANDGEIDPKHLLDELQKRKYDCYLPTLHPLNKTQMVFCKISENTRFTKNRFGILEPEFRSSQRLNPKYLSLVLLPLVAFDLKGNRMGMGGGFYDRAFSFKRRGNDKPTMIGLAYELQRVKQLPVEPWDIPLSGIITEQRHYE